MYDTLNIGCCELFNKCRVTGYVNNFGQRWAITDCCNCGDCVVSDLRPDDAISPAPWWEDGLYSAELANFWGFYPETVEFGSPYYSTPRSFSVGTTLTGRRDLIIEGWAIGATEEAVQQGYEWLQRVAARPCACHCPKPDGTVSVTCEGSTLDAHRFEFISIEKDLYRTPSIPSCNGVWVRIVFRVDGVAHEPVENSETVLPVSPVWSGFTFCDPIIPTEDDCFDPIIVEPPSPQQAVPCWPDCIIVGKTTAMLIGTVDVESDFFFQIIGGVDTIPGIIIRIVREFPSLGTPLTNPENYITRSADCINELQIAQIKKGAVYEVDGRKGKAWKLTPSGCEDLSAQMFGRDGTAFAYDKICCGSKVWAIIEIPCGDYDFTGLRVTVSTFQRRVL